MKYTRMGKNLLKDPDLESQYNAVQSEYLKLDHAEETSSREINIEGKFISFYLRHHAVVRPKHRPQKSE